MEDDFTFVGVFACIGEVIDKYLLYSTSIGHDCVVIINFAGETEIDVWIYSILNIGHSAAAN